MNPAQLLTHFNRIAEAPDAVPRLRRFILDLAVRGKLVEQDVTDEPASELLKRIAMERERIVKAGKIGKEKNLSPVGSEEVSFRAPAGWKWVRIRQVTADRGQTRPDKDFTYIDVTSIDKDVGCIVGAMVIPASEAPSRARKLVAKGDVLYSCVRPYLLNIAIVETDLVPSPIASTAFAVLDGLGLVLSKFLWIALRSPFVIAWVESKMRGQAYPAINDSDFALLPLPLPPFAEQHRIVAKVDELMTLCDRLEAAQAERERRRDRLTAASLNRVNDPTDSDAFTFRESARFHLRHLPRLTTRPDQVSQLRQTIFNLAVCGRLVRQDHNDEPIARTIARHGGERHAPRISRKGETRDGNYEESSLPRGWSWFKGDLVADFVDPQPSHRTPPEYPDGIPYVGYADITSGSGINFTGARKVSPEILSEHRKRYALKRGDFVIGKIGTIGQPFTLPEPFDYTLSANLILVQPNVDVVFPSYLVTFFRSPIAERALRKQQTDSTHAVFGIKKAREFLIPLPPIAEQDRIVAKVDELLALCDRLESQLTTAQNESRQLLESVLHEALSVS